ncbi:MAG: mechanosensitive ion channel [Candidatus Omnitrophica bacterium]|nr:mechanosensitive ion channel [Candidatus Omnitrophota bacterium]
MSSLEKNIIKKIVLPVLIMLVAVHFYFVFYDVIKSNVAEDKLVHMNNWLFTFFAVISTYIVQGAICAFIEWYGANVAEKTKTNVDDEFLPLVKKLAIFLLWTIVTLIVMGRFGIDTKGIVAALGVSSIAIALAAQDTISNIISGFLIVIDRPFRVKDNIKLPTGEKVTVIGIGLRRSQFLAEDGSIIIVPNLDLSKQRIVNYTYGEEAKR